MKKSINEMNVNYVLTPEEEKNVVSGAAAGCYCNVIVGNVWFIAGTLIIVIEREQPEQIA